MEYLGEIRYSGKTCYRNKKKKKILKPRSKRFNRLTSHHIKATTKIRLIISVRFNLKILNDGEYFGEIMKVVGNVIEIKEKIK